MFTVPPTFTAAPSGGSALQNGSCMAARWMICVIPCSTRASRIIAILVMSPVTNRTRLISSSSMMSRRRWMDPPLTSTLVKTPSRTRFFTVHAPIHPVAPVTRNLSLHIYDSLQSPFICLICFIRTSTCERWSSIACRAAIGSRDFNAWTMARWSSMVWRRTSKCSAVRRRLKILS